MMLPSAKGAFLGGNEESILTIYVCIWKYNINARV